MTRIARWASARAVPVLMALVAVLPSGCGPAPQTGEQVRLTDQLGGDDVAGYARADGPRDFVFPADHGPHPGFRNEWWYLTGNLQTADGRRFGVQVTFFRIALAPADPAGEPRRSAWAARELWMTHVALSDVQGRRHLRHERFARGALGLAGAEAEPFWVWHEDWRLGAAPDRSDTHWRLDIDTTDFSLDLEMEPAGPVVLQGQDGLSQKSAEPGNASYYYSIPRLAARGTVETSGERLAVDGLLWLDREWSTSALGPDQVGWDWFALQLDDGRDLMFYRLRRTDGERDPHSAGTISGPNGEVRRLGADDLVAEPVRWWRGPDAVRYPVAWTLSLSGGQDYLVEAVLDDQLMDTKVRYWEGMVDVFDAGSGKVVGRGYLELAGYH